MPVKKLGDGPECYVAGDEVREPSGLLVGGYVRSKDGSYVYKVTKSGLVAESIAYGPLAAKLRLRVLATRCVLPTSYIEFSARNDGYHSVVNDVVLVDEHTGTTYFAPSKSLAPA